MDERKVVEQYVEVLLDQETHAETPEHRSPSTSPEILYSILAYEQWMPDLAGSWL